VANETAVPEGYKPVPPEDRAKAQVFFGHGRTVAAKGNYEYGIEMFLQGLNLDPDAVDAHQELRDIAMKRRASGGKNIGMMEGMKLKRSTKDDKQNLLNAEKLLSYEPGNTDYMLSLLQSALKGGYYDTIMWIGPIFQTANKSDKKQDYNKFIALRDIYKQLKQWKLAADACFFALQLRPQDMDLNTELKNLAAMDTMDGGGYSKRGSFRDSIRDAEKQTRLQHGDKDFVDQDAQSMLIAEAERESKAQPDDPGKAMRLVDALEKTESLDQENRAMDILQQWFDRTKQFRYRQRIGQVQIKQLKRMERAKRAAMAQDPENQELKKDYTTFIKEQNEFELKEYEMAAEAYPTEMRLKYDIGLRLFNLHRFQDAIPIFQQARNDPKFRTDAGLYVARAFLEAGFPDEADDTLAQLIRDYALAGDAKSREMYYWRARALEQKGMVAEAKAHYSKVAQWDFNYRDVQARVKKLKA
jgi:hypothetical protein